MSNIVKHEPRLPALQMDEHELMEVLQSSLYPGASMASIKMVLGYCKAAGLDPMRKPVHIVPMWDRKAKQMRDVTMPGIGLYRTDAARTGEHVGTDEPVFGPMVDYELGGTKVTVPEWCKVTVYRLKNGQKYAYTATEFWIENYATAGKDSDAPNAMWKKRGRGQLAKCAEAQALRKGFPEVGNQPTADEMEGKVLDMGAAEIVQPPQPARLPEWTPEHWALILPKMLAGIKNGKTVADALAWLRAKAEVTPEQEADLYAKVTEAQQGEDAPAVDIDKLAADMRAAPDKETLYTAASLMDAVTDDAQRLRLNEIFDSRLAELEQA